LKPIIFLTSYEVWVVHPSWSRVSCTLENFWTRNRVAQPKNCIALAELGIINVSIFVRESQFFAFHFCYNLYNSNLFFSNSDSTTSFALAAAISPVLVSIQYPFVPKAYKETCLKIDVIKLTLFWIFKNFSTKIFSRQLKKVEKLWGSKTNVCVFNLSIGVTQLSLSHILRQRQGVDFTNISWAAFSYKRFCNLCLYVGVYRVRQKFCAKVKEIRWKRHNININNKLCYLER